MASIILSQFTRPLGLLLDLQDLSRLLSGLSSPNTLDQNHSIWLDYCSCRVEDTSNPQPEFGLEIARAGYVEPAKFSTAKLTELYNERGLDPSDQRVRHTVALKHRRTLFDKWVKAGTGLDPDGETHTPPMPDPASSTSVLEHPQLFEASAPYRRRGGWACNATIFVEEESPGWALVFKHV
ncbi:hypothetical protein BDR22DRAFT_892984 [Usnea florida]